MSNQEWVTLFESGRYEEALKVAVLSGTCAGAQMQAIAALVIAESTTRLATIYAAESRAA